jgi:5'-nucleotidase (lipoprotein e(P4) family)
MKPILQSGIALLCAFGLSGCQTTSGKRADATPACATPSPAAVLADDSFRAALWQQSAAEYDALSLQAYTRAESMLDLALNQASWSALDPGELQAAPTGPGLAIITDIDETLVDNSAFTVRQMREPVPSCMTVAEARADWDRRWLEWVSDAEATAMPGAAEFMQFAAKRPGVEIFYITNRKDNEKAATCKNLIAVGFPVKSCDTHVLTRNDADGRKKDKVSRRQEVARTHRVVLVFGDNLGDFIGNVLTNEAERDAIVAKRRDWWGQRWFMLPNPAYGSWEEILGAITDRPDDFATAAERAAYVRAQKERRLQDCRSKDCLKP